MVGLGMALKKTQETFLHYIAVLYTCFSLKLDANFTTRVSCLQE